MEIKDKSGLLKPEKIDKAFDNLLEELDQNAAGPELKDGAELKNEATVEKEPESAAPSIDNKDVYCDKTHEQEESVEGVVVKEEESQTANGPELGTAGELKNEATVEGEGESTEPSVDNKDVYCDACHDQKEAGEGVVVKEDILSELELETDPEAEDAEDEFGAESEKAPTAEDPVAVEDTVSEVNSLTEEAEGEEEKKEEDEKEESEKSEDDSKKEKNSESEEKEEHAEEEEKETVDESFESLFTLLRTINEEASQLAAGPELKDGAELKNEATVEGEGESTEPSVDNKDVYCDEVHKEEDTFMAPVQEAVDYICSLNDEDGNNLLEFIAANDTEIANIIFEALDAEANGKSLNEGLFSKIADKAKKARIDADFGEKMYHLNRAFSSQKAADKVRNKLRAKQQYEAGAEARKNAKAAVIDAKAAKKKAELDGDLKAIEDSKNKLAAAKANRKALSERNIRKNMNAISKENRKTEKANLEKNLKDENIARKQKVDENRALKAEGKRNYHLAKAGLSLKESSDFELMKWLDKNNYEPTMENVKILREADSQTANGPELGTAGELKNEATVEKEPEAATPSVDNKDVYCDACHNQKEAGEGVVVKEEESQTANGPELVNGAELKNEATVEGEGESTESSVDNKEVYTADLHKQVENVVGIVVEAAANCRKSGKKATLTNICESLMKLYEESEADPKDMMGVGKEFADKSYDVDATLVSKEMNGSDKFENYEKLQGEEADAALSAQVPAEAVHESVKYTSLREACMLDEDYFISDTYTKQTSEEKIQKLTEQVSLLMAREANDPLYDELLKESIYCKRLQEQCHNKYASQARVKAEKIIKK